VVRFLPLGVRFLPLVVRFLLNLLLRFFWVPPYFLYAGICVPSLQIQEAHRPAHAPAAPPNIDPRLDAANIVPADAAGFKVVTAAATAPPKLAPTFAPLTSNSIPLIYIYIFFLLIYFKNTIYLYKIGILDVQRCKESEHTY
jgi:hypothetical protein